MGLEIVIEESGDVSGIRLNGRLDAATSPLLERQIALLLEENQKKILIDFSSVDYLSSAGLRLLLSTTKRLKGKGGKLALFGMMEEVLEIVKMAGFERILRHFATEEQALQDLNS